MPAIRRSCWRITAAFSTRWAGNAACCQSQPPQPPGRACGQGGATRSGDAARIFTASARASRLLLEAPDVRAAIPGVLGLIGEAARVDRVNLMQTRTGPNGERLLVVTSEWTVEGVTPSLLGSTPCICDEGQVAAVCAELRAGRSVCFSKGESLPNNAYSAIEGIGTQIVDKGCVGGDFTFVDAELFDDNLFYFLINGCHSFSSLQAPRAACAEFLLRIKPEIFREQERINRTRQCKGRSESV